jgi:hypothetical protein
MIKRTSLDSRLANLERQRGVKFVVLHFPDRSTTALRIRKKLPLLLAAWNMLWYFEHGRHGDRYSSEQARSEPYVLEVLDRRQTLVRLIGRAERIEADDGKFFSMLHRACAEAVAAEKEPLREAIVFSN